MKELKPTTVYRCRMIHPHGFQRSAIQATDPDKKAKRQKVSLAKKDQVVNLKGELASKLQDSGRLEVLSVASEFTKAQNRTGPNPKKGAGAKKGGVTRKPKGEEPDPNEGGASD